MTIARYAVTSGLAGCYMPDNGPWAFSVSSRTELADIIRSEIENADFPKSSFGQVRIRNLWGFIKRRGSSCAHFSIEHNGWEIAFHGLTEDEFAEYEREQD